MCRCKLLIPHLKIPAFSNGGEFVTLLKTSYLDKVVKNWSHPKFGYWGESKPQRYFDSGSACWSQRGRIDRILLANSAEQMQMELWGLNCTYNSLQGAFWCYFFELWSAWLCLEPVIWKHPPGADPVLGCTRLSCAQGCGTWCCPEPRRSQEPGAFIRDNAIGWDMQEQGRLSLSKGFNFSRGYKGEMDLYPMIPTGCSYRFMQRFLFQRCQRSLCGHSGLMLTSVVLDLGWHQGFNFVWP